MTLVSCASLLISIVFIITVESMKVKHKRDVVIFDLLTVTINDYTVEIDLSEKQINNFWRDHYKSGDKKPEALQL